MFQGVILNLLGFSSAFTGRAALQGQAFAVFLIVIAAAEAAMALGLVVLLFRPPADPGCGSMDGAVGLEGQ